MITPCAVVVPEGDRDLTFGGSHQTKFGIIVAVDAASLRVAQDSLDAYMSHSGASSIQAAIEGDLTLGSIVDTTLWQGWDDYGIIEIDNTPYWAAKASLEVIH